MKATHGVGNAALGMAIIVTAVVAGSFYAERSVPPGLLPHGVCFSWLPSLLWLHVISDALIGVAYFSIPIGLLFLVRRRSDLPLNWMFLLFGLFIVSCGLTHLIGIWTVWYPYYWFAGSVKAVTAAASVMTALAMIPALPRALRIPTTGQLQRANEELQREVARRREAEEQLRRAHAELEQRVAERTRDLAEARASSERLRLAAEEANQLKDRFLAKVSHELRTPLQALLSWSAVLGMQVEPEHRAAGAARRIADNVNAQARLIDDLLDISRILSGKLRLELASVNAAEVITRALDVVQPGADRAGVTIERQLALAGTTLVTDPARLEQVVWNLVNNAIQASRAGDTVVVQARMVDDALEISVKDQGIGISQEDVARIFEPFQQGHSSASHRGLGLGLAISRNIVSLLRGQVSVHSAGRGLGATFTLVLPLATGPLSERATAALSEAERDLLRTIRVLYVEDNPDVADAMGAALAPMVSSLTLAYSAQEALQTFEQSAPDVLVSDLHLNDEIDGHALLRRLREQRAFDGPAIALSAFGEESDRRRSRDAGFSTHLVKPATAGDVARAIAGALRAAERTET